MQRKFHGHGLLRLHSFRSQISRIRLSEMLRRRSTPFVSEEEGQQLRQRLQANAKKISLEVPSGAAAASPPSSSSGARRVSGGAARRKPQKGLTRQTTLALLTLDEDEQGHYEY